MRLAGVGVLTGWGTGVAALPADARQAAGGRRVVALAAPPPSERLRRATRECLLGVAAVRTLLATARLEPAAIAGVDTALLYVSAGAYGAANRAFIESPGGALHFPYTAPSAVPAEVTIEFGLTGPYVILIGGGAVTIEGIAQAERWLSEGVCARALVLAVETFAECADLYGRARWAAGLPLVEAAACALFTPGPPVVIAGPAPAASRLADRARRRAGETFACGPLIGLALARETGDDSWSITGRWRGRSAALMTR